MIGPPDNRTRLAGNETHSEDQAGGRSTLSVEREAHPAPVLAAPDVDAVTAPCRRCGHPLTAPRSVSRGIGPVCVHLARGETR